MMMTTIVTMIPAVDTPLDALPSLLAHAGSDTALLLANTVHTLSTHLTHVDGFTVFTAV